MRRKDPDWQLLAASVRERREAFEKSQQQVADEAGVSQRYVSKIEAGRCRRPGLQLLRVLSVLGLAQEAALPTGLDDPIEHTTDDWRVESWYPFWARRPEPLTFRTEDGVVASLPKAPYDFTLVLRGPAHVKVEKVHGSYTVTVRFDGRPDAEIVIKEDAL